MTASVDRNSLWDCSICGNILYCRIDSSRRVSSCFNLYQFQKVSSVLLSSSTVDQSESRLISYLPNYWITYCTYPHSTCSNIFLHFRPLINDCSTLIWLFSRCSENRDCCNFSCPIRNWLSSHGQNRSPRLGPSTPCLTHKLLKFPQLSLPFPHSSQLQSKPTNS